MPSDPLEAESLQLQDNFWYIETIERTSCWNYGGIRWPFKELYLLCDWGWVDLRPLPSLVAVPSYRIPHKNFLYELFHFLLFKRSSQACHAIETARPGQQWWPSWRPILCLLDLQYHWAGSAVPSWATFSASLLQPWAALPLQSLAGSSPSFPVVLFLDVSSSPFETIYISWLWYHLYWRPKFISPTLLNSRILRLLIWYFHLVI